MKKPRKRDEWLYKHKGYVNQTIDTPNYENIGHNKGLKVYEAYHKWDIKENYIKKSIFEKVQRENKLLKAQLRKFGEIFDNFNNNKGGK